MILVVLLVILVLVFLVIVMVVMMIVVMVVVMIVVMVVVVVVMLHLRVRIFLASLFVVVRQVLEKEWELARSFPPSPLPLPSSYLPFSLSVCSFVRLSSPVLSVLPSLSLV